MSKTTEELLEKQDKRCGTYAGFVAHGKKYEKKCEPCRLAGNEYRRNKTPPRINPPIIRDNCGTSAGYKAHEMRGEITCDPCRLAINEAVRLRNQPIKELRAERSRTYRAKNTAHVREVEAQWRIKNPEKRRAKDMTRLARKKGSKKVERLSVPDVIARWGAVCHSCEKPIDLSLPRHVKDSLWGLHLDHVIPLSAGGEHTLENVKPSHAICNLRKGAKVLFIV